MARLVEESTRRGSTDSLEALTLRSPKLDMRTRPYHALSPEEGMIESVASGFFDGPAVRPGPGLAGGRGASSKISRGFIGLAALNMGLLLMIMQYLSVAGTKQQDLFFLYYQPFAPMLSMLWLWGVNVRYFEGRGVRYDVCFAAQDQKYLLPAASIFQIANVLSSITLASAAVFLFYCVAGNFDAAAYHPPLVYLAMLGMLLFPGGILHRDTRRFFASTIWRVMTPIRGVTWADFLLADVLTSLAKALSDTERAVCHLVTGPVMAPLSGSCDDSSWLIPAGLAMPYLWRLVQCLRVHADTGARPQLWNALKYSTAIPLIVLSFAKYHVSVEEWRGTYKPMWLAAAVLNSSYSFFWDLERDWEVGFFTQMRPQRRLLPTPVLQPALLYPRAFYLYLMLSNALLRLSWTYKLSPHLRRNHVAVFFIVLAEALRRFQWMFVRVEVELRKLQHARPELGQLVPPLPPAAAVTEKEMRILREDSDASLNDVTL